MDGMAVRARPRPPRGNDSWRLAVARARESWDELTGAPPAPVGFEPGLQLQVTEPDGSFTYRPIERRGYSDQAAASILTTALGLWTDTAATLAG